MSDLRLSVVPVSVPPGAQLMAAELAGLILGHPALKGRLGGSRHRLLSLVFLDPEFKTDSPSPPNLYRATIYDYDNNRTILAEGRLDEAQFIKLSESKTRPLPSSEEREAALGILQKDAELGPSLREQRLRTYRPMPPLIAGDERTLAIGLSPSDIRKANEIVGVNMTRQVIVRFPEGAPPSALASRRACGIPGAGQPSITSLPSGTTGNLSISVTAADGSPLWDLVVVRPVASSGTNGSGIELRFVSYRGTLVLHRAHVPILNVRYDNDACGPFRDWQNEEGFFQADGTDEAPGFRRCPSPAQTILDSGTDAGNHAGVAIFTEGQELVLVSEMEAGWYRYISEWRLHEDGTIRPRFGFSAVADPCVCNVHHHHVYWRFDFDIGGAPNNVVSEYNEPPVGSLFNWNVIENEVRRRKDVPRRRKWYVQNSVTGKGYLLIPGSEDGVADDFGVGDLWVVRFKANEIDDGQGFTTDPDEAKADIDGFVNGEPVRNQDVVVWYAAHFRHNVSESAGHVVGPDLVPAEFIGGLLAAQGRVTFLRVHDVGTGFGPDIDFIDVEVVIQLDSEPGKAFGFQLRSDQNEEAHRRMLDILRDAFRRNAVVRIDYLRTGLKNGIMLRAAELPG